METTSEPTTVPSTTTERTVPQSRDVTTTVKPAIPKVRYDAYYMHNGMKFVNLGLILLTNPGDE